MDLRILCVGDVHFRHSSIVENDLLIEKLKEKVWESSPDIVVFMGDLLHNHGTTYVQPFNQVLKLLKEIGSICTVYVLVGNHDYINNSQFLSDNHFLKAFGGLDRVKIVDRVVSHYGLILMPYVPAGRFVEALDTCEGWKSAKAIFCHQDFYGVELNGIKMEHGDKWPEDFPLVISGHIHEHQWLEKNICYVGAPYMTTFAETDEKGLSLFEFGESVKHTRIDLGMPKKLTVKLTLDQVKKFKVPENTHLRLMLEGEASALSAFKKTKGYSELAQKNVKIVLCPTENELSLNATIVKKTYLELLKEMVGSDDTELMSIFNEALA